MKLEDLLDKQKIAAIDSLGMPTRKIIEELDKKDLEAALSLSNIALFTKSENAVIESAKTIGKYDENVMWSIAQGLSNIAENTEDKDAVIEAAKTIGKYESYPASSIAQGLEDIAKNTNDKDKIITVAKIMSLDEILNIRVKAGFEELTHIAAYTGSKDAVIEAAKTIGKYESYPAREIANELDNVAKYTKDKDAVIEAAKTISKYDLYFAYNISYGLDSIARDTKDKNAVIEAAKTIGKYDENAMWSIAQGLGYVARHTKDKDKIITAAKIMSLDEILNVGVKDGFGELTHIAAYTGSKDAVIEAAKTISKYDSYFAYNISYGLDSIARDTKDKDAVIEAAKTIGKYDENAARDITYRLQDITVGSGEGVIATCRIINLIGADALDLLETKDFIDIGKRKLDDLIYDKESFDAVAAYMKSCFELPAPNKINITNYKEIASRYLSEKYGINKNLNTNQILMLFSVDKNERKDLAWFINDSNETGLKTYSISTGETKRLEVDTKRLPYLSLIAVTGSKDKTLDKEAYQLISEIVGEKAVRKARSEFKSHYRDKIKGIAAYVKEGEVNKAINSLKAVKNESIGDVLECANYKNAGFTKGKAVLSAVESNNPLDYDSRIQIACVYLPNDYHGGIYNYCKDYYSEGNGKGFTLVRYNLGGEALGSAICYMEKNNFLVDSVEGHRTFRKPQIFQAVYQDLIDRAKEKGAKKIIFSENGINETPKEFIEFLDGLGLKGESVKMELDTEGYLEAEKYMVKGYSVNLN